MELMGKDFEFPEAGTKIITGITPDALRALRALKVGDVLKLDPPDFYEDSEVGRGTIYHQVHRRLKWICQIRVQHHPSCIYVRRVE